MQSEGIDKKIKEAAEHYFPAYDETAWKKMKRVLDVHMPQNKNDRWKLLFLLFIVMLTGGGLYIAIDQPWKNNSTTSARPVNGNEKPERAGHGNPSSVQPGIGTELTTETSTETINNTLRDFADAGTPISSSSTISVQPSSTGVTPPSERKTPAQENTNQNSIIENAELVRDESNIVNNRKNEPAAESQAKAEVEDEDNVNISSTTGAETKTIAGNQKPEENQVSQKNNTSKKSKFLNNLGFTISAGPDVSAVRPSQMGKTTLIFGAGIRYDVSKKLSLRSGFYVTDKIYTAEPGDYHPPKNYWTNYIYLEQVDADCRIFEIPITVNYNFQQGKKHNLFATAGLSSYFMKKETYYYHYYDQSGQYQYNGWSMENKNRHLFAIATLGAGYERKFGDKLSLSVEPYVKLPLGGVGFGKIKLSSGGVMLTATVKPFASTQKK